jgi:hypothetical protein
MDRDGHDTARSFRVETKTGQEPSFGIAAQISPYRTFKSRALVCERLTPADSPS